MLSGSGSYGTGPPSPGGDGALRLPLVLFPGTLPHHPRRNSTSSRFTASGVSHCRK